MADISLLHGAAAEALSPEKIATDLERARSRTSWLTDLDESELRSVHSPIMSPLVWDLAHVAQQEELWLLRRGEAARPGLLPVEVDRLYDAFEHPRAARSQLPLLPPVEARRYGHEVRARVLGELEVSTDLYPYAMVVQHEEQHDETMLTEHSIVTAIWHILTNGDYYHDPGSDYYTRRSPERTIRRKIKNLEAAGYAITRTA